MSSAALDRLLALLVLGVLGSGLIALRMGDPGDGWLFVGHGLLATGLAFAAVAKVGRSLPRAVRSRRWRAIAVGLLVSIAASAALAAGFAWALGGRLLWVGSWTVLTLHAWAGLVLVPILAVHLLPRRWRLLLPSAPATRSAAVARRAVVARGRAATRRQVLTVGALGIAAAGAYGIAQIADRLAGGVRRFTGSRWLPAGGIPPPTTFYGEAGPSIDPATWRLHVRGRVARPLALTVEELLALGVADVTAVLDCTSGWAIRTTWRGVPVAAVLRASGADPAARRVTMRSATGWAAVLTAADVDRALLATSVAGTDLPAANGAPCRLVIPDRRGLDWVKWLSEIEIA